MATVKARINNAWAPLSSGNVWDAAWGVVGTAQLASTFTTSAPHMTAQATGLSVTMNEVVGRRLSIRVQHNPYPSGGVQAVGFSLPHVRCHSDRWVGHVLGVDLRHWCQHGGV